MNTHESYEDYFKKDVVLADTIMVKDALKFAEVYAVRYRGKGPEHRRKLKGLIDNLPDAYITKFTKLLRAINDGRITTVVTHLEELLVLHRPKPIDYKE